MEEFLVLFLVIVLLLVWYHVRRPYAEWFTDVAPAAAAAKGEEAREVEGFTSDSTVYQLRACPAGMKLFHDSMGTAMCCDGEILAGRCITDKQCVLTGGTKETSCATMVQKEYTEKAQTLCPASMPTYYETREGDHVVKKACTDGPLDTSLSGPRSDRQAECVIYPSMEENQMRPDSCYLRQKLDAVACFGQDCTKQIISTGGTKPALIAVSFTDPAGIHHTAYTQASMEAYLNATKPQWRETGLDLSKNLSVVEVAKAFYVDKTLSKQDIQL